MDGSIEKSDVETKNDRQFAVINLNYELEQKPQKLILDYNMFLDDSEPGHANYETITLDGKQQEAVLTFESRELAINTLFLILINENWLN